jgi:hypothetical protein
MHTTKDIISSYQSEASHEPLDSNKVLAPNFVSTCNDRDVTEGKMTRHA